MKVPPPPTDAAATPSPWVLLAALAWQATGCLGPGVFHCADKRQCGDGYCESTGACSFTDASGSCPSGRRYGAHAPDALAGRCVQDACPRNPVLGLRAGGAHACAVGQNGGMACWGAGTDGQLGDGAQLSRSTPLELGANSLGPVRDAALGDRHTCALVQDGSVWCWGANEAGQLGDGTAVAHALPAPVRDDQGGALTQVVALAAGGAFSCAVRATGTVLCWGNNTDGQLGQGSGGDPSAPTPRPVPALEQAGVRALSARDRHICALTAAGAVWCWGANEQGQLGDGTRLSRPTPAPVDGLGGHAVNAIAAGAAHTCAVGAGLLWCWGTNALGELGDGSNQDRLVPTRVTLANPAGITAGGHHTCARQDDGGVWCWGGNQAGQLGEGTTSNFGVPVPVTGVADADDLAAGDMFSCARRRDGTVWCWGDDRLGQLGIGAAIERLSPTAVGAPILGGVVGLGAGGAHTCAIRQGPPADALCWGDNQAGQIGDGTRLDRSQPAPLKISLDAAQIAAGALHTCLLDTAGGIWCWGRGSSGQLGGAAALIDSAVPTAVPDLGPALGLGLGAGGAHSCVVRGDGSVWCWGSNTEGQLGDGTTSGRASPAPVPGQGDVVEVALGAAHTCARRRDGSVGCWGRGVEGQLGDGQSTSASRPVAVRDINTAVALAAGANHSCALLGDLSVRCWGAGTAGQLGWGSLADHAIASRVMNVGGAVQITAGDRHTCARTTLDGRADSAGSVFCWGDNRAGQLGDGTHDLDQGLGPTLNAPVLNGDALAIAAGGSHTCAVRRDHTVACWGANSAGQLGDGSTLQMPTAQMARIPCP